jgi:hypothetical protein
MSSSGKSHVIFVIFGQGGDDLLLVVVPLVLPELLDLPQLEFKKYLFERGLKSGKLLFLEY